ncbi:MAG: translation initiation factor IF-3 [Verrucomicrobiae bacterium]|nr:translation initiation factor IF-3 [Verrucomicrobiae bacterium]
MSQPRPHHSSGSSHSFIRINGKIRAREVRVIGDDNKQLGVFPLGDALRMARERGVDLVEISPNANPPVCRLVDYGKYRYEQEKKEKEQRKHQHANKMKEVQLSATIDPHDFKVKLRHAIDFLCDDMKVKVTLRFRGREMAHQEIGMQQVDKFVQELRPWGQADYTPKLAGRNVHVTISPLPKNKRAKHPDEAEAQPAGGPPGGSPKAAAAERPAGAAPGARGEPPASVPAAQAAQAGGFGNNPFSQLEIKS